MDLGDDSGQNNEILDSRCQMETVCMYKTKCMIASPSFGRFCSMFDSKVAVARHFDYMLFTQLFIQDGPIF
jgi:hypothetical protein